MYVRSPAPTSTTTAVASPCRSSCCSPDGGLTNRTLDSGRIADRGSPPGWEQFAERDALRYIDPSLGRDVSAREFIESGGALIERELAWAGPLAAYDRALEIGCGIGRNTVHLARRFEHVDAIDVSPTMIELAREHGMPANVTLHVGSGEDLAQFADQSFALVFSHLVFQHIARAQAVESYMHEIGRVLAPGGVALLQFDTRPASLPAALVQRLPDGLLPADRRRGMRRYRRRAGEIRDLGRAAGLALEAERDPGSAAHWLRWRRPPTKP